MEVYSNGLPQDYIIPHQTCSLYKCQDYLWSGCQNSGKLFDGIEGPSWLYDLCPTEPESERYQSNVGSKCSTCDESCSTYQNTVSSCLNCKSCSSSCSEVTCSSCTCTCSYTRSSEISNSEIKSRKPSRIIIMTPSINTSSSSTSNFGQKLKNKLKDTTNHFFKKKTDSIIRDTELNVMSPCNKNETEVINIKDTSSECLAQSSSEITITLNNNEVLQSESKINDLDNLDGFMATENPNSCDNISTISSKRTILLKNNNVLLEETIQEIPDDLLVDDCDADSNFTEIPLDENVTSSSIYVKDVKPKKKMKQKPCLYSVMLGLYKEESWRAHGNDDLKQIISDIDRKMSLDHIGSKDFNYKPKDFDYKIQSADLYPDEDIEVSTSSKKFPIKLDKARYEAIKKYGKVEDDVDKLISKMKRWEVILYKKLGFIKIVNDE